MKTNRFKYLVTAFLPIAALATPAYAQKIYAKATLSPNVPQADADNEQAKPNAYQLFGHGDPKLDSLSRQLDHYGKLLHDYNHSKTYESLNARAKGFSTSVHSFYNNDTLRHIMASLDKIVKDFNTFQSYDLAMKKDSLGSIVGDYFKAPKFAGTNAGLQKKYHIDPAKVYTTDNANYRAYHDELLKKMPENILKDLQQLKDLSAQFRERLQSPEYVADVKQLHVLLDSMKSYYKTKHTEQYTYASYKATMDVPADEQRKAQDELRVYLQNPEIHNYSEKLNEYGKEMRDYYKNSPAAKEHENAWKNELKTILADDYDIILHPGRGLEGLYNN